MMFLKSYFTQRHSFHLVDVSVMPLVTASTALTTTIGGVMFFHGYAFGYPTLLFGLFSLIVCFFLWWRDIVSEATFEGVHTNVVQLGMRYGMILFIASEVMFFFGFFWAFFAASLAPTVELGNIWPPKGIVPFNALDIPLLNTLILLCSGVTITYSHHAITAGNKLQAVWGLVLTVVLAIIFTMFQAYEYTSAPFVISDGIYGSTFYMATGFHGFHVFVGTCFLSVCLVRMLLNHFTTTHHFGFEAAAFYWHFVDVVWLFLYVAVYFWGGN